MDVVVLLYEYTTIRLYDCTTMLVYYDTLLLYCYTDILLYCYTDYTGVQDARALLRPVAAQHFNFPLLFSVL